MYMACRSREKGMKAVEAIEKGGVFGFEGIVYPDEGGGMSNGNDNGTRKGKGRLEFLEMDLADLTSIEKAVEEFQRYVIDLR